MSKPFEGWLRLAEVQANLLEDVRASKQAYPLYPIYIYVYVAGSRPRGVYALGFVLFLCMSGSCFRLRWQVRLRVEVPAAQVIVGFAVLSQGQVLGSIYLYDNNASVVTTSCRFCIKINSCLVL